MITRVISESSRNTLRDHRMLSNRAIRPLRAFVFTGILLAVTAPLWGQTTATRASDACVLPVGLQQQLATEYPKLRPVKLSDLEEDDKKYFQADHHSSCPGIVKVDFYGDGKPTLALVLI